MIKPSIGRVVWYYPGGLQAVLQNVQPQPAIVCYVHGDRMVNLAIFSPSGLQYSAISVPLVQEGDNTPDHAFACWMPYQIGQAKKHESAPKS